MWEVEIIDKKMTNPLNNDSLKQEIRKILNEVKDPEIPSISVVDLGMVEEITVNGDTASIKVLPTFVGCPALDIIKAQIESAILKIEGIKEAKVEFIYQPPWTSDRITEKGRNCLKEYGIAPPPKFFSEKGIFEVHCPYCNSPYTTMENIFGPTACRSILYCRTCKNPFEAMKPISTLM